MKFIGGTSPYLLRKSGPSRIITKIFLAAVCAGTHHPDIKAQKIGLSHAGKTKMQAPGAVMKKRIQFFRV